ncbi:MAG: tRNA 4-thiouridine(8) synthase ThiI [Lentisphaerae bacterium]|nr:tRNA 4-thiouridine(8) synthase ThiI [Lentisphaerota bacterium]
MMQDFSNIVVHYAEIGLKAQNRGYFEKLLLRNIHRKLGDAYLAGRRESGQLTLALRADADRAAVCDTLGRIPGIAYFCPAWSIRADMEVFKATAIALLTGRTFTTFKVDTHRPHKQNPFKSMQVNRELGAAIWNAFPGKKVKLADPDVVVKLELTEKATYMSVDRYPGVGGLPTNARQRVVALISGGLDSPVAAYLMMKRGCEVELVHFQNQSQVTAAVEDKIVQLARQLARYQIHTRLHIVPFEDLQREIIKGVHATLRMLLYRRLMLDLAGRLAATRRAKFLVTGDSFSQVASQTYDNLAATYANCPMPVLAPLIGLDKREIVAIAEGIGTYAVSSQPYEDCCSFFVPKHPELHAQAVGLSRVAADLPLEPLIAQALAQTRVSEF